MFFFIGGVQPKTTTLEHAPQRCTRCGSNQVVLQRVDHYLSLFFIPVLRVKKGQPFLFCPHCRLPLEDFQRGWTGAAENNAPALCRQCSRRLEPHYVYCPYCGGRR